MHKVVILLIATAILGSFAKQAHSQSDEPTRYLCGWIWVNLTGQELHTDYLPEDVISSRPVQNELWKLNSGRGLCPETCRGPSPLFFPEPVEPLEVSCIIGLGGSRLCKATAIAPPRSVTICEYGTEEQPRNPGEPGEL